MIWVILKEAVLLVSGQRPSEMDSHASDVFAAVRTEDVVFARQEAAANQRHAALFAVEAVIVPLALLK